MNTKKQESWPPALVLRARFAPSCTGILLRSVSDLAERTGTKVHTHAAETPVELELVTRETGLDELAYLVSVGISGERAALAHCVWVDGDGIGRLARQRTGVVHCPSSNLKLGSGIAPVPEMLAAGCRVAIGADGAPCNNRLDGFAEMRLAALIQKPRLGPEALPAAQVLEMATLGGARVLGLERDIGSVERGKRADLVVLDLSGPHAQPDEADLVSRIVYSARAADVRHVLVDGRIVVRDGRLRTAKLDEIRREVFFPWIPFPQRFPTHRHNYYTNHSPSLVKLKKLIFKLKPFVPGG